MDRNPDGTNSEGGDRTNSEGGYRINPDGGNVFLHMSNDEGEVMILDIIRMELALDLGGEELEHKLALVDPVDEAKISSFFNTSGDGEEQEQVDRGHTNNNDSPSTTTDEVYILSLLWLDALIDPHIHINHCAFYF